MYFYSYTALCVDLIRYKITLKQIVYVRYELENERNFKTSVFSRGVKPDVYTVSVYSIVYAIKTKFVLEKTLKLYFFVKLMT